MAHHHGHRTYVGRLIVIHIELVLSGLFHLYLHPSVFSKSHYLPKLWNAGNVSRNILWSADTRRLYPQEMSGMRLGFGYREDSQFLTHDCGAIFNQRGQYIAARGGEACSACIASTVKAAACFVTYCSETPENSCHK